jgi:hypothetical protein
MEQTTPPIGTAAAPPPQAPPAPAVTVKPSGSGFSFFDAARGFLAWVFTGFGAFRGDKNSEEVVCYTVDKGFYLWALIIAGFVGGAWARHWPGSGLFWGWVYLLTLIYTVVLLLRELDTWRFVFWIGVITFIYLIAKYPLARLGILPGLGRYITTLQPVINPDWAVLTSWGLLILFFGSLYQTFAQGRKTITPNTIEEWHFGRGSESMDRGGLRFKTSYPDVLETLLGFGSGDLVAYDRANRVVKRYEGILFLFFKWNKLDTVLHRRFAVVDNVANDVVDVHDIDHDPVHHEAL